MKNFYYNLVPAVLLASFPFSCQTANGAVHTVFSINITDFQKNQNTDIGFKPIGEAEYGNLARDGLKELFLVGLTPHLTSPTLGEGYKEASVCFITDAANCSGYDFSNTENAPKPIPPGHVDPESECARAGYESGACPEGSHAETFCPISSSYHTPCVCDSDMTQTCVSPYEGVGPSCGGKYRECCNTCPGYDATSVPTGYVMESECDSCDGKKYKIKCDPSVYVSSASCGTNGGTGSTCTDSAGTYYKECNCPNNYEWSSTQKACICSSSFKYTCTGNGYAGGSGNSCDGKYSTCSCSSGYTWNAATGACACAGTDFCILNQNCAALGYKNNITCTGDVLRCPFDTGYVFCL